MARTPTDPMKPDPRLDVLKKFMGRDVKELRYLTFPDHFAVLIIRIDGQAFQACVGFDGKNRTGCKHKDLTARLLRD